MTDTGLFSLPAWRNAMGLTQQQAAEVLGLHLRTVQRYEHGGEIVPSVVLLACQGLLLRRRLGELLATWL